jgi:hypothetical protein
MIDHLPTRSANMPKGILAAMAVKDKRLIIIPSSKVVAPFSTMYKGRIGWVICVARKSVIDVAVRK